MSARATSTPITIPAIVPPDGIEWIEGTAVAVDVADVAVAVVCVVDVLMPDEELELELVDLIAVDFEVLVVVEELDELELEETTAACGIITHLIPSMH